MTTFELGNTITLRASIKDNCFQTSDFYTVADINAGIGQPAITIYPFSCLTAQGVELEFQWTNASGTTEQKTCEFGTRLKSLGTAVTNSQGVAERQYTISQEDVDIYNQNNQLFDLRVCILNSPNVDLLNLSNVRRNFQATDPKIVLVDVEWTVIIRQYLRPWGWNALPDAVQKVMLKIPEFEAAIFSELSKLTGNKATYLKTVVYENGTDVIVESYFKEQSTSTGLSSHKVIALVSPLLIGIVLIAAGAVILWFGLTYKTETEHRTDPKVTEPADPENWKDQIPAIADDASGTIFGNEMNTCNEVKIAADGLDGIHEGMYGVLTIIYPNFQEFTDTYNKYLHYFSNIATDCDETIEGRKPINIKYKLQTEFDQYELEQKDDMVAFNELYKKERCCLYIDSLKTCVIPSEWCSTATLIGYGMLTAAVLYAGYVVYTNLSDNYGIRKITKQREQHI